MTLRKPRLYLRTANTLTTIRLLLIPVVIYLLLHASANPGNRRTAFFILFFQQASDIADGFLARRAKHIAESAGLTAPRNAFGAVLDPVADKLFLNSTYITVSALGWFPWWPTGVFLAKDLALVVGWIVLTLRAKTIQVRPSVFGKAAETLQAGLVFLVVLDFSPELLFAGAVLTVSAVVLAGITYVTRELRPA